MKNKEREAYQLSQYVIDHDLYDDVCKASRTANIKDHPKPPAEDEITRCLREVKTKGTISVTSVFACRIWLDILSIPENDVGRGHKELLKAASMVSSSINATGIFSEEVAMPVCWLTKDSNLPLRIETRCRMWISMSPMSMMKRDNIAKLPRGWDREPNFEGLDMSQNREESKLATYTKEQQNTAKRSNLRGVELPKNPKFTSMSSTVMKVPDGFDPRDPAVMEQLRIKALTEAGIDDHSPVSAEHEENARRLDVKPITPHRDANFFFTHNPVYCGTVALVSCLPRIKTPKTPFIEAIDCSLRSELFCEPGTL